jgi:hypothetical protein
LKALATNYYQNYQRADASRERGEPCLIDHCHRS